MTTTEFKSVWSLVCQMEDEIRLAALDGLIDEEASQSDKVFSSDSEIVVDNDSGV